MTGSSETLNRHSSDTSSALGEALGQLDRIVDRLGLDAASHALLRSPLREHHIALPITAANVSRIHGRVRVVAEAANGPVTMDASQALEDRGVLVIPDILTNAGGVTCSYFEQVQGNSNYYWSSDEVFQKLDSWMAEAFRSVHQRAEDEAVSLRDAAYLIAVDRVARACRERGWV